MKGVINMKLKNAIMVFDITEEDMNNLIIHDKGKTTEYYIDQRSTVDSNFNNVVFPLGGNDIRYCYVCPNCQHIHQRRKRTRFIDAEGNVINNPDYFQIPEHEIPAESILEWKTQTEVDNNMVLVNDPEGMTVYNPSVDSMFFDLQHRVLATGNKELIHCFDVVFNEKRPDLWDEDVKKC